LKQDNHQDFKIHSQENTMHSYIQYSGLKALSTLFLSSVAYWCSQHRHRSRT